MEWVMQTGNVPVAVPGKPGCLSGGGGGIVPPALLDERSLPPFYLEAIALCGAFSPSALPNTALVYKLMVRSLLPRAVLSYIWSAVNRTLPGQLTRAEFFSALALIALAQRGESLAALSSMGELPLPSLQQQQSATPSPSSSRSEVGVLQQHCVQQHAMPVPSCTSIKAAQALLEQPRAAAAGTAAKALPKRDLLDLESSDEEEQTDGAAASRSERQAVAARMMDAAERVVADVMALFDKRTSDVLREVCRTERGSRLMARVGLLVGVMRRLSGARQGSTVGVEWSSRAEACAAKWAHLDALAVHEQSEDAQLEAGDERCALCEGASASLSYGGSMYHGVCANLWVNHVDPVLPIHMQQLR